MLDLAPLFVEAAQIVTRKRAAWARYLRRVPGLAERATPQCNQLAVAVSLSRNRECGGGGRVEDFAGQDRDRQSSNHGSGTPIRDRGSL